MANINSHQIIKLTNNENKLSFLIINKTKTLNDFLYFLFFAQFYNFKYLVLFI